MKSIPSAFVLLGLLIGNCAFAQEAGSTTETTKVKTKKKKHGKETSTTVTTTTKETPR